MLFGYPLLLARLARRARKSGRGTIKKQFQERTVSVILPVYNGEMWLAAKLESILAMDYPPHLVDILVLSDGSTDGTAEIAQRFTSQAHVQILELPKGGKSEAINAGLKLAQGEILFFTDVRQPLDRHCLRNLISCFAEQSVGVVSGELIIRKGSSREEANVGLYWKYEKWIRKNLSSIDSVPGATGAVYAMRRELARPLPPYTLLDDVYLPMCAYFAGYRIVFDDSAIAYDYPASLNTEFRRKVRTLAGVYQLIGEFPALIGPGNRMCLHFVSHKLGRLLMPFGLLLVLVSSFWLPAPYALLAILGQAAFYLVAAIDAVMPESIPFKRLSSPIRTFTVLMIASFCAASIWFLPAKMFWVPTRAGRK